MLPELTPEQRRRCNALIKRLCANYDGGNCIALDDGDGCVCVQSISYHIYCKYFRNAVLPAEPMLEADIFKSDTRAKCEQCHKPFVQEHHNQKYCKDCAKLRYRRQQAKYAAEKRLENRKSKP